MLAIWVRPPTVCWVALRDRDAANGRHEKNEPNTLPTPWASSSWLVSIEYLSFSENSRAMDMVIEYATIAMITLSVITLISKFTGGGLKSGKPLSISPICKDSEKKMINKLIYDCRQSYKLVCASLRIRVW